MNSSLELSLINPVTQIIVLSLSFSGSWQMEALRFSALFQCMNFYMELAHEWSQVWAKAMFIQHRLIYSLHFDVFGVNLVMFPDTIPSLQYSIWYSLWTNGSQPVGHSPLRGVGGTRVLSDPFTESLQTTGKYRYLYYSS